MTSYTVIDPSINSHCTVHAKNARQARRIVVEEMGFDSYEDYLRTTKGHGGSRRVFVAVRQGRGSLWLCLGPEQRQALRWVSGLDDDKPTCIGAIRRMAELGYLRIENDGEILMTTKGAAAWAGRPDTRT
jgi:hypothetical protein